MTKKGWTRILIVVVAGLWAYNIYRTVENYQVVAETQAINQAVTNSFVPIVFNKDSFALELPDIDPFLKKQTSFTRSTVSQNTPSTTQRVTQTTVAAPPVVESWPEINYYGYVKNRDQDKTLCMLSINKKMTRLSKGEKNQNLVVVETYADSVVLEMDGKRKTFVKGGGR